MLVKTLPAKVKAVGSADGLAEGEFHALVSVFNNIDSYGDVVMPGSFADDLAEWAAKGDPIPVVWSHDWSNPFSHLGTVVEAKEVTEGLWVHGRIEDLDSNATAGQVYRLLKGRRVTQFSFAYDVLDGGWGERDDREVYELRKMHVHEVGPCLLGANRDTELLAVKARQMAQDAKAGVGVRALDLGQLKAARADLDAILAAAEEAGTNPADQPPSGAKISDNPANPQREGVPDLDLPSGTAPIDGAPTDPPPGREVDEGSGVVHPEDAKSTTPETGQQPDETASTEPDGAPPAKSSPNSPAQVTARAQLDLLTNVMI